LGTKVRRSGGNNSKSCREFHFDFKFDMNAKEGCFYFSEKKEKIVHHLTLPIPSQHTLRFMLYHFDIFSTLHL